MLQIDTDLKAVSMISDTRFNANNDNRVQTFDLHILEVSSDKYLATKAGLNSLIKITFLLKCLITSSSQMISLDQMEEDKFILMLWR